MGACVLSCSVVTTLCNLRDCSPPDSSVHGILQARILEWVYISSSKGSNPGIKPSSLVSPALKADSLPPSHQGSCEAGLITSKFTLKGTNAVVKELLQEAERESDPRRL